MYDFQNLLSQNSFYWFCALSGSGMFIIQFLLSLFGGISSDLEAGVEDSANVKWLSKQAVSGFLMLFGWTSLTCQNQFHLATSATLLLGIAAGALTVVLTGWLFKMTRKLHSSGTVFSLEDAVGKEATVYQTIPKDGIGKISISLHHHTHEVDAISQNNDVLPSFSSVRVIKKLSDNVVVVTAI